MESELKPIYLTCTDCKRRFIFTAEERKKFGFKGWADPIRCKYCRRQKKLLNLALKDNQDITDEIKFNEVCDDCGRPFYSKFSKKPGEKIYCDDCWAEIKYGENRKKN